MLIDVGLNKCQVVFEFLECLQRLSITINLFLWVNANISWLIMLVVSFVSQLIKDRVDFNNDK
jgi:hypothetical protein